MVPKIPALPYRKVHRILHRAGFRPIRQRGSHIFYEHPDGRSTEVPRHARDINASLVKKILEDAKLDPAAFRR
ncbi:MAG: type II toxin-antitoxin system HicA family toxin [bacterium]